MGQNSVKLAPTVGRDYEASEQNSRWDDATLAVRFGAH